MRKLFVLIPALAVMLFASTVSADVVYDESVDGPLSNDQFNPTTLVLNTPGTSKLIASTQFDPLAADFFTVSIPDGFQLDEVIWGVFETNELRSFFAVEEGSQITSTSTSEFLLGTAFITPDSVATDVLDDLGNATLGGSGFTGPLGPGDYTFWFQETGDDVNYGMSFIVTSIPEPTSAMVLAGLGLVGLCRRRK